MKATRFLISVMVLAGMAAQDALSEQTPMGTAFTYQGRLEEHGHSADGWYDFRFILYDAVVGGNQVGKTIEIEDEPVDNGLFTVVLDFGENVFTGDARWLEVAVRPGDSSGDYTVLSPRQELTPAPYAIHAATAAAVPGVIRGEGTPGYIPMFTQPRYIEDSVIYESDTGNIGINTDQPAEKLDVNGTVKATAIDLNGDKRTAWPDIPTGVIVMWSGLLTDIPDDWALCDGRKGTPDLTSRFIRSVPDDQTDPGSQGGSEAHTHGPGSYSASSHTHTYSGTTGPGGSPENCLSGDPQRPSYHEHTHSYSGTTNPGGAGAITGTSAEASSLPPYYELAFIMKLPEAKGGR